MLGDGEHTARSAGAVINPVGGVLNLIAYRNKGKIRNQLHDVTRRKMTPGVGDIGFLVEFPDHFLENGAHRMIVQRGQGNSRSVGHRPGGKVDGGIGKFADQETEDIML